MITDVPTRSASSSSERAALLRRRDAAKGLRQLNVRVPEIYDTSIQMLARELRAGLRLEGFVIRDPKTGGLKTLIV